MQWRGLSCQISFYINECETCIRWITWPQSTWPQSGKMDWFFLKSVGGTNWRLIVMIAFPIFQARLLQQTPIRFYSSTVHSGWCGTQKSRWIKSEKMDCVDSTNWPMELGDGEFLWTVNYHGHFFSKCPNSSGIFQRMNILDIFDEFLRTFFVHQSSSS